MNRSQDPWRGGPRLVTRVAGIALAGLLGIAAAADAAVGDLTPQGCIDDHDAGQGDDTCAGSAEGLFGAGPVAVSADGRSVYVATRGDNAIVRLNRDPATGAVVSAGCVDDNDNGPDDCAASTDGLGAPQEVAVSADGLSVYAASYADSAIVSFARSVTGELTPAGCIEDNDTGPDNCAASSDGLEKADGVTVSPDGRSVYAVSSTENAIVRFVRDVNTGALTPAGCIEDNDIGPDNCATTADGLGGVTSITVSPDGASAYAASDNDAAIVHFSRDLGSGALTFAGCVDHPLFPENCASSAPGLSGAGSIAISPDGRSLYAAGFFDDAIVRFDRDPAAGTVTPVDCIDDNDTGPSACAAESDGLDGVDSLVVSPDGASLYAVGFFDDAVTGFDRNLATGALTPSGCIDDDDTGDDTCTVATSGLRGALSVAVSPDGRSAYAAGLGDDSVVRFDREPAGAPDTDPPETEITKGPKRKTEKRKAKLKFISDEAGASFECKLDRKPFKACKSPLRKKVKAGRKHKLKVRAIDPAGNVDPTPDRHKWKVLTP